MALKRPGRKWDAGGVRALRRHMELTQEQLAEALGVRQQTVSEWETGQYQPRGASEKLLSIVADAADYDYGQTSSERRDAEDANVEVGDAPGRAPREGSAR